MAERIELFQVTTPSGTAIATPLTTTLSMDECVVERIDVTVPSGPSGFMGFRFAHSGQIVIPYRGANWLITDDAELSWPVQGYPTGNRWTCVSYNTDIFDHTIYIRMLVNEIPAKRPATLSIVSIG